MGTLCFSLSALTLFIALTDLFFVAHTTTHWRDIEVLKQLKNGLDPNSVSQGSCLSSWDFNFDPCDSLFSEKFTCGFRCDSVDSGPSRVTELTLDQAGYSGSLGSSSWDLPYLQTLDLSGNYFTGSIPNSFSNLTRLRQLTLSRSSLSGSIPSSIGSLYALEELYLDNNRLEGTIPSGLNGLKNLKRLELQGNKISGGFPDLGQLSNLYFVDASDNLISGDSSGLPRRAFYEEQPDRTEYSGEYSELGLSTGHGPESQQAIRVGSVDPFHPPVSPAIDPGVQPIRFGSSTGRLGHPERAHSR